MWSQGDKERRSQLSACASNNNSLHISDRNSEEVGTTDLPSQKRVIVERLTNEVQTSLNLLRCNESLTTADDSETQGDYLKRVKASRRSSLTTSSPRLSPAGDRRQPPSTLLSPSLLAPRHATLSLSHYNTRSSAGSAGKSATPDSSHKSKNNRSAAKVVRSRGRRRCRHSVVDSALTSSHLKLCSSPLMPYSLRHNSNTILTDPPTLQRLSCRISARTSA